MLWNKIKENRKAVIVIAEIIVLIAYSIYVLLDYNGTELVYQQEDMQIQNIDSNFDAGNYLDISFENAKAIVTPAFFLQRGVYNVSFNYRENGIVKAGFIYEQARNGRELVDDEEFVINPKCSEISYRITMKDNTGVRFKLRLTGDACGDDYIILDDFSIVQSKLSIVYRIFILFAVMMLVNSALIVYEKFLRGGGGFPAEGYYSRSWHYSIYCRITVF